VRTRPEISSLLLLFVFGISSPAIAQRHLKNELSDPAVLRGLADIESDANISAQQLVEIGGIISPSKQELKRAKLSQRLCRRLDCEMLKLPAAPMPWLGYLVPLEMQFFCSDSGCACYRRQVSVGRRKLSHCRRRSVSGLSHSVLLPLLR
jgi:hypothetical protein